MKINENIRMYKKYCNTYYINDEKKLLIDAGALINEEIDIIILTHFHPDHWIFLKQLIDKNPEALLMIGEEDAEPFNRICKITPDKLLKNGDVIKTGNYSWEIIHSPGHTVGGISLWNKEYKILFSGDTLFSEGITGRTDLPYSKPEEMKETINKLKKLNYRILLPGHGKLTQNF